MKASTEHGAWSALELVEAIARDPSLRDDPAVRARHDRILDNASVCSFCGVGCPYTVEPDARQKPQIVPLSELGLCVKGTTSLLTGGHEQRRARLASRGLPDDRIRAPMIRAHDGTMREVSWDEALDRAAWLFLHAREWVGPEAVAIYGNGQKTLESIWMASLYKLVFRMPTIGANSEHCLASAGAAHELNFGNEASFTASRFDELAGCDVAVLHGTNAFITFPQAYEKLARNTRALKVVIDPVRTDTVSELQAIDPRTLHIQFRQGGDVLFNLAVARVILDEGWEDEAFLRRAVSAESLAALRALCAEDRCVPETAAARIALPAQDVGALAATIRRYAALLAKPREGGERPKVAFVSSMGINQSTGSYGFSTNLNLLLLTGNVGRQGAGSLRIAGQSNATSELLLGFNGRRLLFNLDPKSPEHRAALSRALDLPEENFPRAPGTPVARMADDDHLYCFLFVGTQMTRNMPRLGHWQRRMGRAFNVVIDPFLGEGVLEHADVILPALTYTERVGIIQRGDRTLQLQQRISEPPPLAWSDEQILAQLALAIAWRLRDPDTAAINELDPDVVHRTFARYLDAEGQVDPSAIFDHMVEVSRALDLYSRLEDGEGRPLSHAMLRESAGRGVQWGGDGRYADAARDGAVFPGLSRSQKAQARLVRPPDAFLAELDAPLPPGTLSLISGRGIPGQRARFNRGRYNSGIKTLPISGRPSDDYFVELNPEVARAEGLSPDQAVRLVSAHGVVVARVALNDRVPQGVATIDFVPGEVNRLTDYVDADRFTNQSLIKRTPVQLRALRPLEEALWIAPNGDALREVVSILFASYRATFPTDDDWLATC
ncbi:MAG: molybdopterin-dependent oxidoreductase [Byssovorax sp.]